MIYFCIICVYKLEILSEEFNVGCFYFCSRMKLRELKKDKYILFICLLLMVMVKILVIGYCVLD